MNRVLVLWCAGMIIMFCAGCGSGTDSAALAIGPFGITAEEFEAEFQRSRYAQAGAAGRAAFLEHYMDVRLILLEAERAGLDKEPEFLKDIQRFWEQALLKRMLEQKNREILNGPGVSRQEVEEYYERNRDDFQGRTVEEAYDQARWMVMKVKQSRALSDWTRQLREKTDIRVNKALLGMEQ